ncbi:MAG: MotA/TolQ/ExbB proton channel family protein [Planctomycetota bacterium]
MSKLRYHSLLFASLLAVLAAAFVSAQAQPSPTGTEAKAEATPTPGSEAAANTETKAGSGEDEEDHPETYFDFAMAGGYLMLPLVLLSLVWLTFLVERMVALQRRRVFPNSFGQALLSIPSGSLESSRVESLVREFPSSAARVIEVAAGRLGDDLPEIESAVNAAAQREIHGLRKHIGVFAVIAAVAPLLGLLGTVTGMIQAFREVALQGLGSGQVFAPGIYKALITTAAGLVVAIPALITHSWATSRVSTYVHQMDDLAVTFTDRHRARSGNAESDS